MKSQGKSITTSGNFSDWFKGSSIVDDDGKPLVIYHGSKTPENLTEFKIGGVENSILSGDVYGVGAYFTSSSKEAASYIGDCGAIFPVYVTGEILDLDAPNLSAEQSMRLTDLAAKLLLPSDKARFPIGRERREFSDRADAIDFFDSQRQNWAQFGDGMSRAQPEATVEGSMFVVEFTNFDAAVSINSGYDAMIFFKAVGWDNLRCAGFDGLKMSRDGDGLWVIMHNTDGTIKSVTGNNGLYDAYCSDITDRTTRKLALHGESLQVGAIEGNGLMGVRSGLGEEDIALNGCSVGDNFRKWFGTSKVVDAAGEPAVVFHGSTRGGVSSSTVSSTFFSSSRDVATTYSEDDYHLSKGVESVVQAMYLKIERPLEVDAKYAPWMRIEFEGRRYTTDDLASVARQRGFDGLIIRNVEDNVNDEELSASDVYVTLGKKSQIKSAENNTGIFDPESNDIFDRDSARKFATLNLVNQARSAIDQDTQVGRKYAPR